MSEKHQNITLIGMTSCGKTTLGKRLAKEFSMEFIDFDEVIFEKYGRVIDNQGESTFKELEQKVMLEASGTNTVFSCGGSAVFSDTAMKHLKSLSVIMYLSVPFIVIESRLSENAQKQIIGSRVRPLLDIYNERVPLYKKYADVTIKVENSSIPQQYEALRERVGVLKNKM